MKRVLLTGASGFIGRHCIPPLLECGYEIHAVSTRLRPDLDSRVIWHPVNLLDPRQTVALVESIKPTHLLHLAWYAVPGRFWQATENVDWVKASLTLLEAFSSGGERAVVAGTCAEYDWEYGYCSEGVTPQNPATLYGSCKNALREILLPFSRQQGLSFAWGRVFLLYGPYEDPKRLVPSVILSMLRGMPACCTHGRQIRDILYVADVASAFVALLEGELEGPVNIASGRPVALRDVVTQIGDTLGRPELIRFDALPAPANDPPFLVADVRRLTRCGGWEPRFSLEEGVAETVEWWREQIRTSLAP